MNGVAQDGSKLSTSPVLALLAEHCGSVALDKLNLACNTAMMLIAWEVK